VLDCAHGHQEENQEKVDNEENRQSEVEAGAEEADEETDHANEIGEASGRSEKGFAQENEKEGREQNRQPQGHGCAQKKDSDKEPRSVWLSARCILVG